MKIKIFKKNKILIKKHGAPQWANKKQNISLKNRAIIEKEMIKNYFKIFLNNYKSEHQWFRFPRNNKEMAINSDTLNNIMKTAFKNIGN
ncbi:hypothetical protein MNBD_GAMMA12-612 [hydrothermal vent metagenome]|uniref:Uncharacterized protein n=1 Tax=hydrothermal vent metagenome TaxID=652676 RepID=A0A3B0YVY0_9ZZZZ